MTTASTPNDLNVHQFADQPTEKACAERHYTVTRADLPLCCPTPSMTLWNAHPRVYFPIEKTGTATCPYCDAKFTLVDH